MARIKVYSPPAATIDWLSFTDCILSTNWSRYTDFKNQMGLSSNVANRAWHGKPIGLVPFLRICKRMGIDPMKFLVER